MKKKVNELKLLFKQKFTEMKETTSEEIREEISEATKTFMSSLFFSVQKKF